MKTVCGSERFRGCLKHTSWHGSAHDLLVNRCRYQCTGNSALPDLCHRGITTCSTTPPLGIKAILSLKSALIGRAMTSDCAAWLKRAFSTSWIQTIILPYSSVPCGHCHVSGLPPLLIDMRWQNAGIWCQRRLRSNARSITIADGRLCLWTTPHAGFVDILLADC